MLCYLGSSSYADQDSIPEENTVAQLEIDNHADTSCFGSSFVPLYWTGQVCDVTPFLSDYAPMTNVHIVTGRTIIMKFHQGLWFGNKMPQSQPVSSLWYTDL